MTAEGMQIEKYFSKDRDPYSSEVMGYAKRDVIIKDDDGNVIETITGATFPSFWSHHAANTVATKYFRKEGVPQTGREVDLRQLAGRVAKTVANWGQKQGYFDYTNAKTLEEELVAATVFQHGAFNSPVWFSLGLDTYGIKEDGEGFYVEGGEVRKTDNLAEHPQISACFIVSPKDSIESMMNVSAIISSRIFKRGSGIGGYWGYVRGSGESVAGGGVASGAKRFMDVQDSCARVIKSGGKTRRAATFQGIPVWHPDMPDIIRDKYAEEQKARVLVANGSPGKWESHTIQNLRGQNVNISVRCDDEFWKAYESDSDYSVKSVVTGKALRKEKARHLAKLMAFCAHGCGDPGIQNHNTINKWNTCPNSGEIVASNPCSEYMFLDNSACNLASLNLMRFRKPDGNFDLDTFSKAVDLYITSQDILVSQASYPSREIAENSHKFRPLGLGFANLGAYLMSLGLAYDSDEARDFAAAVASNMTAEAYLQSARLAEKLGAFEEFEKNKQPMMEVLEMHKKAAKQISARNGLEGLVGNLKESALKKWNEAIELGSRVGFRNAQVTLLAPTGTIGYMMDCDTTGGEPEMALKKYKEMAGGGSMTIVNQTVPLALEMLGYHESQTKDIVDYIDKNQTIEGAPHIKPEHLPVFDCSMQAGEGVRAISSLGHLRMLGAIQPHVSGAMSKTVNCPESTTVEEIQDMMYQGWKLGIKAIAIYRDGSKVAQPVRTKKSGKLEVLTRGEREVLPNSRIGINQKVKVGDISLFLRTGEYSDGRLGELFIDSLERGSEVNRLLNEVAIQFSEKLQYGVPLERALEVFSKAGRSQIAGLTDHPFIKNARGPEGFIYDWITAHYLGDISFIPRGTNGESEIRPLPQELRVYHHIPRLHMIPSVDGEPMYPGAPTLEDTIKRISNTNFWCDKDKGMDTRQTIDKIRRTRKWKNENTIDIQTAGRMTGRTCDKCGNMMISDGSCWKCPSCIVSTGGCGGG